MTKESLDIIGNLIDGEFEKLITVKAKIIEFFGRYTLENPWVYPGLIARNFDVSRCTDGVLLESLVQMEILELYYETRCKDCGHIDGNVYKYATEMPETFMCEVCEQESSIFSNAWRVYKLIKE